MCLKNWLEQEPLFGSVIVSANYSSNSRSKYDETAETIGKRKYWTMPGMTATTIMLIAIAAITLRDSDGESIDRSPVRLG